MKTGAIFPVFRIFIRNLARISKNCITFAPAKSGCSAVGSALRSGRRGRAFESPHPDFRSLQQKNKWLLCNHLFLFYIVTSATSSLREPIRMTFQFLDEFTDLVKFTSNAYVLRTMRLALMATDTVIRLTLWRYYAV